MTNRLQLSAGSAYLELVLLMPLILLILAASAEAGYASLHAAQMQAVLSSVDAEIVRLERKLHPFHTTQSTLIDVDDVRYATLADQLADLLATEAMRLSSRYQLQIDAIATAVDTHNGEPLHSTVVARVIRRSPSPPVGIDHNATPNVSALDTTRAMLTEFILTPRYAPITLSLKVSMYGEYRSLYPEQLKAHLGKTFQYAHVRSITVFPSEIF